MMEKKGNCVILLGFSGGGKTTVGRLLSERRGIPDYDTDAMIAQREGTSIKEIFAEKGEAYFRDLETALLEELLAAPPKAAVIAIGGGMPVREVNRGYLKRLGTVIYLAATVDTLERRLAGSSDRPLLQAENLRRRIETMMAAREQIYLETADVVLHTDDLTPAQTAWAVEREVYG